MDSLRTELSGKPNLGGGAVAISKGLMRSQRSPSRLFLIGHQSLDVESVLNTGWFHVNCMISCNFMPQTLFPKMVSSQVQGLQFGNVFHMSTHYSDIRVGKLK